MNFAHFKSCRSFRCNLLTRNAPALQMCAWVAAVSFPFSGGDQTSKRKSGQASGNRASPNFLLTPGTCPLCHSRVRSPPGKGKETAAMQTTQMYSCHVVLTHARMQWNLDIMEDQGTGKICSLVAVYYKIAYKENYMTIVSCSCHSHTSFITYGPMSRENPLKLKLDSVGLLHQQRRAV